MNIKPTIKDFDCFLHQRLILPSSLVKTNDLKGNRAFSSKDRSVFPLGIEGSVKLHLVVGWSTREIGRIKELQVHALAPGEQLRFVKSNVRIIFDPTSRRSGNPVSSWYQSSVDSVGSLSSYLNFIFFLYTKKPYKKKFFQP